MSDIHAVNQQKQRAYHALFTSPGGREVLADLIPYCFGRKSTFDPDARVHARNEGRRDVLMYIVELTNLTLEEIYQLRGFARPIAQQEDTDG